LLRASAAFAGACLFGSAVSVRNDLAGEPLGIRLPIAVRVGLLIGLGAGVAAPWPMPVAGLIAAWSATRRDSSRMPGRFCAGLGMACIAGTLVEPVIRRPRSWTPGVAAAIALNVVTSVALIATGLRHANRERNR
jgi:hypothetical protein